MAHRRLCAASNPKSHRRSDLHTLCGRSKRCTHRDGLRTAALRCKATCARPAWRMPRRSAAASLRSMMSWGLKGPRSLMRTVTSRPLLRLTTRTRLPKGRVLCAAVKAWRSKRSPLAVRRPCHRLPPYQVASPRCSNVVGSSCAKASLTRTSTCSEASGDAASAGASGTAADTAPHHKAKANAKTLNGFSAPTEHPAWRHSGSWCRSAAKAHRHG